MAIEMVMVTVTVNRQTQIISSAGIHAAKLYTQLSASCIEVLPAICCMAGVSMISRAIFARAIKIISIEGILAKGRYRIAL